MTHGLEKLETAKTFRDTAMLLAYDFTEHDQTKSAEENNKREHELRFNKSKVYHFLFSIVFELAIKVIWEVENRQECEHHHRLSDFYFCLSSEKQSKIRQLYDQQSALIRTQQLEISPGNWITADQLAEYQSLEEALETNASTVTDFKYDGCYRGKSSVISGVIFREEKALIDILPRNFIVFPTQLVQYAEEIVKSQGL